MRTACSICLHPRRAEIDTRLASGSALIPTATLYGVSKSALGRHRLRCQGRRPITRTVIAVASPEAPPRTPADLSKALEPLRIEAAAQRPTPDQLLTFSAYLVLQAGAQAVEQDDRIGMIRAAREARNLAALELDTSEERERLADRERHQQHVEPIWAMMNKIFGPEPIEEPGNDKK